MKPKGIVQFLLILAFGFIIASFASCKKDKIVRAPEPVNPQQIPCDACQPFAGYYALRDVSVNRINGIDVWSPVPVGTINGRIFGGYIILNTFSEIVVFQTGEAYNYQSFTTEPYTFTLLYNYWITNDSVITVGPETAPGVSGIYETDSAFAGVIGNTYTLNIDLAEEIDEQKSYSSACKMMKVAKLDSIQVVFQDDWGEKGYWEIRLYAQEPGDEVNYYMFHYYRNDTLMTDSIWKVPASDDSFFNGNYINGITAVFINNANYWETLHPGDKVTLQMSGITKEYYEFLFQVQIAGYNIPFFMGPPANVQGNIDNGGIGFFNAYSNSWASTIVK
jgi:hypothetical protein